MLKSLPLTFVQQALEQTLLEEHIKNNHYFGGKDQISLVSFYEQLKTQNEIDRFVETVRDLNDQQNRTGLIGNGVLLSPENPTITNLYSSTIIPFTWTCSIRTTLGNRDAMVETLQNLIEKLKGRKCDIAQLECEDFEGKPIPSLFKVGTLGQTDNYPHIKKGDYLGVVSYNQNLTTRLNSIISSLDSIGISRTLAYGDYFYFTKVGAYGLTPRLQVALYQQNEYIDNDPTIDSSSISKTTITSGSTTTYKSTLNLTLTIPNVIVSPNTKSVHIKATARCSHPGSTILNTFSINTDMNITSFTLTGTDLTLVCNATIVNNAIDYTVETYDILSIKVSYKINEFVQIEDDGTYPDVVFPPEQTPSDLGFDKFKLSISFDSFRIDEPHNLNGNEYCEISFGGSATLCNENVYLGNDLVKVGVQKNKILATTPIEFSNATIYYLEPLEMPSGLNANTQITQLISNNFKQNTHTDGTAGILQYSFIMDKSFDILKQWFDYARFGTYGITASDICPNLIYNVSEFWSSWGVVDKHTLLCKITESIDIENTESDVLTLGVNFQIQGANN